MMRPTFEEQSDAFERYAALKRRCDETKSFDDARLAGEAWVTFLNLYLPDDQQMPVRKRTGGNVSLFPVHKARAPQIEQVDDVN